MTRAKEGSHSFTWYFINIISIFTFRVSRRPREMYCGHARLCVCLSVCVPVRGRVPTLLHGPECNLGEWYGMPPSCALLGGFATVSYTHLTLPTIYSV